MNAPCGQRAHELLLQRGEALRAPPPVTERVLHLNLRRGRPVVEVHLHRVGHAPPVGVQIVGRVLRVLNLLTKHVVSLIANVTHKINSPPSLGGVTRRSEGPAPPHPRSAPR